MFGGLAVCTIHVLAKVTFPFFCGVPSCTVVWNNPSPVPEKGKKGNLQETIILKEIPRKEHTTLFAFQEKVTRKTQMNLLQLEFPVDHFRVAVNLIMKAFHLKITSFVCI